MNRHRYRTVGLGITELCTAEQDGKPCGLHYSASLHYNDVDHPYVPPEEGSTDNGCRWTLQDPRATRNGDALWCEVPPDSFVHEASRKTWGSAPVGMPDVAAEALAAARPETLSDAESLERPESGGAAERGGDGWSAELHKSETESVKNRLMTALAEEAAQYAWTQHRHQRKGAMRMLEGDQATKAPWETVVSTLLSSRGSVEHGPWPVRRYVLRDGAGTGGLRDMLSSLLDLEIDHTVQTWRPDGATYRLVLVTWGWANGIGVEAICDELALQYDDGPAGSSTLSADEQD